MRSIIILPAILSALIAIATTSAGEESDFLAILKTGDDVKSLPPGVVVRVQADLSKSAAAKKRSEARGSQSEDEFKETWEFTSDHVHQLEFESRKKSGEMVYRRVKSLAFDSTNVCKDLMDGKVRTIADEDGMGEPLHFVGTDYDRGDRSIEILVEGKNWLHLGESCAFAGYQETDARAFAELYEKLAKQARDAFAAKPARSTAKN